MSVAAAAATASALFVITLFLLLSSQVSLQHLCHQLVSGRFVAFHTDVLVSAGAPPGTSCYEPWSVGSSVGVPLPAQQPMAVRYPAENWSLAGHLRACTLLSDQSRGFPGASQVACVLDRWIFCRAEEGLPYPALPGNAFPHESPLASFLLGTWFRQRGFCMYHFPPDSPKWKPGIWELGLFFCSLNERLAGRLVNTVQFLTSLFQEGPPEPVGTFSYC